jgi:methyl-accepting chemotaxis protein
VNKVSSLNNEISNASTEQFTGLEQISKAMNQLDQTSQNNAASAEEIASTASAIAGETKHMNELVIELHTVING